MSEIMRNGNDVAKEQIRVLVSDIYDIQEMRIAQGNRLVQSFYQQLGVKPSESPENADKDAQKLIKRIMADHDKITNAIAELMKDGSGGDFSSVTESTIKKAIKKLNDSSDKKDSLDVIRNNIDYHMVNSYIRFNDIEKEKIKVLDTFVKAHPMWDAFFKDVKGCGTLMSAVCLAYLDPYKARHVSCFYVYCGVDVVRETDEDGNSIYIAVDDENKKVVGIPDDDGTERYFYVDDMDKEYVGAVEFSEHGRRKGDTEMKPYTAKDGTTKMKRGITYNPKLKTKLMGVLTGCLMKAKDPVYSKIYTDYKARLLKMDKHKDKSAGHINMMAQRYMIKQFLRNMWVTWRQLEGLAVDEPYEVAKLGNAPHGVNQYQCDVARKQREAI